MGPNKHPRAKPASLLITIAIACAVLVGCDALVCDVSAERSATVPAAGINIVRIIAEAGSLDVEGRIDLTEISATGTACASNTADVDDIQFDVTTSGSEVVIEARTPDGNARFDVTVVVPESAVVDIEDGSGSVEVRDVAEVLITDGSGDVYVTDVSGDVLVMDDGSGDLDLRDIAGSVEIEVDGSGGIEVAEVGGNVLIGSDGSGDIRVADIGGDFEVGSGGSGNISHSNVGGTVDIPNDS